MLSETSNSSMHENDIALANFLGGECINFLIDLSKDDSESQSKLEEIPSNVLSSKEIAPKKAAPHCMGNCSYITDQERKVDHTYVDYFSSPPDAPSLLDRNCSLNNTKPTKDMFPSKLMNILRKESFSNVVSWCSHGRAFKVRNVQKFEKDILPRYFKTTHMSSFRKQLSLWGFKRITKGTDAGCYYHQAFLRGMPKLLKFLRYKKIKGVGRAPKPNPIAEPNFYRLKPLPQYRRQITPTKRSPLHSKLPMPINSDSNLNYSNSTCELGGGNPISSCFASIVSDEEDFDLEEYLFVNRQMSFPGPFLPPPELISGSAG